MKALSLVIVGLCALTLSACETYTPEEKKQISLHFAALSKCATGKHVLAHVNENSKEGWKAIKEYSCTEYCGESQLDKSLDGKIYTAEDFKALEANNRHEQFINYPYVKPCPFIFLSPPDSTQP